jgi:hypothetical protein
MCAEPTKNEETIYYEAVSKPPKERKAYLKAACGDDAELLARIEALLKAREVEDSFLEVPDLDPNVTLDVSPISERPGTVIGRYKLLEQVESHLKLSNWAWIPNQSLPDSRPNARPWR